MSSLSNTTEQDTTTAGRSVAGRASPPPATPPRGAVHHATSADIAEHRADIKRRIERDVGFMETQELASAHQRESERRWCEAEGVMRTFVAPVTRSGGGKRAARPPAGATRGGPAEAAAAIRAGHMRCRVAYLPSAGGIRLSETFEDALLCCLRSADGAGDGLFDIHYPVGNSAASLDDMRHAGVVAMFGTNAMRGDIPNFPFVYAMLELAPDARPVAPKSSKKAPASPRRERHISSRAKNPDPGIALLVERGVCSGPSVKDAIHTLDGFTFFLIFVQVVCAIRHAYTVANFTHYDLSASNVYLDDPDAGGRPRHISYRATSGVSVSAPFVVHFADFGFAHISISNADERTVSFGFSAEGKSRLVEYGIHRDRAHPMSDVYRFLMSSARASDPKSSVRAMCESLFEFFNGEESLDAALDAQYDPVGGYFLPQTQNAKGYLFDELISHCNRITRRPANREKLAGTVAEDGTDALVYASGRGWVPEVAAGVPEPPADLIAFFDAYIAMLASGDESDLCAAKAYASAFSKGFRTGKSCFHRGAEALTAKVESVSAELKDEMMVPPRLIPSTARAFTKRVEGEVVDSVLRAHRIFALFQRLVLYRRVLLYCISVYWKTKTPKDVGNVFHECNTALEDAIVRFAASVSNVAVYAVAESARFEETASRTSKAPSAAAHLKDAFGSLSHAACEVLNTTPENVRTKYSI